MLFILSATITVNSQDKHGRIWDNCQIIFPCRAHQLLIKLTLQNTKAGGKSQTSLVALERRRSHAPVTMGPNFGKNMNCRQWPETNYLFILFEMWHDAHEFKRQFYKWRKSKFVVQPFKYQTMKVCFAADTVHSSSSLRFLHWYSCCFSKII